MVDEGEDVHNGGMNRREQPKYTQGKRMSGINTYLLSGS